MSEPAVELTNVVKTYGKGIVSVPVLKGLTSRIETGERVALLGKSGSGKSTLLNLLGGLDRLTSGHISVFGSQLHELASRQMAEYRLDTVGIIFQGYNLLSAKTTRQKVELPSIIGGLSPRDRRVAAERALDAVGLSDRRDHKPTELSGGEQQRVAIARAFGTPVMGVNLWGGSPLCDSGSLRRISIPNDLLRSSKHEARATAVRATGRGEEACGCVA